MANQVPLLLVGFAVTALMFAMANRQSEISRLEYDVNRANSRLDSHQRLHVPKNREEQAWSHLHTNEGSHLTINGIRGWY